MLLISTSVSLSMCTPQVRVPASPGSLDAAMTALHSVQQASALQQSRLRKLPPGTFPVPADGAMPWLDLEAPSEAPTAVVHLVGVGPGDVELLTVKALRLMQTADLLLYDRLISPEILSLVNEDAAMLYVGKEAGLHTRPQDEIHSLMLSFATAGRTVVRLKGGDPTVFGRGGEELEYLEQQGVPVHVVPGVTAAAGVAAGLGVPLTHRDHADSVRFVTGHARSENTTPVQERYHWAQLADPKTTLVIYMGLSTLGELTQGLLDAGMPADMPAVAVQDGTTPTQRVVQAPLESLAAEVASEELRSPTLVIIGNVVSLLQERGGAPGLGVGAAVPQASMMAATSINARSPPQLTAELTADEVLAILAQVKQAA